MLRGRSTSVAGWGVLLLLAQAVRLCAQTPIVVDARREVYDLTPRLHILFDTTGQLTVTDLYQRMRQGRYPSDGRRLISVGNRSSANWLLFRVISQEKDPGTWTVELPNPHINRVQFHYFTHHDTVHYPETGDHYRFTARVIRHPKFLFPIKLHPGDTAWCLMMIEKPNEYMPVMALRLHREYSFFSYDYQEQARNNALLALLIFNFFITLVFALQFRLPTFNWYLALLFVNFLYVISVSGLGFRYAWPDYPGFNGWARALYLALLPSVFVGFTSTYFSIKSQFSRTAQAILALLGACMLAFPFFDSLPNPRTESVSFLVLSTLGLLGMIGISLVMTWQGFRQGNARNARWFLAAYSLMLIAIIINLLAYYGLLRNRTAITFFLASIVAELTVLTVRVCMQGYLLQRKTLELQIALERERSGAMQQLVQSMDKVNQFVGDLLHDEIGALLALTRLNAEQLANKQLILSPADWNKQYAYTLGLIDKTVDEVRQFAHRFSAIPVDRLGLLDAIGKQLHEVNRTSTTQFEFVGLGDDQLLSRDLSVNAYRILLSLINNILRHAEAEHALIQVIVRQDSLSMLAEDNGKGFDTRQLEIEGFEFISNRVYAFGGTLSVESGADTGTVVAIEIPIR